MAEEEVKKTLDRMQARDAKALDKVMARDAAFTKIIGHYETQGGEVGAKVKHWRSDGGSEGYSWTGKWGSGSTNSLSGIKQAISSALNGKRNYKTLIDVMGYNGG